MSFDDVIPTPFISISFFSFEPLRCSGAISCADFVFDIHLSFTCVEIRSLRSKYIPKLKDSFTKKKNFFYFDTSKWSVGGWNPSHCISKSIRNVVVFNSRF